MTAKSYTLLEAAGSGFGNLLRKELKAWWSPRRWWKHCLLWLVLMNGLVPLIYLIVRANPEAPLDMLDQLVRGFFQLGGVAATVGAVVSAQDAIIGERQAGTAEWVLSKPASRLAFVLAKFLALLVSMIALTAALQTAIAYGQVYLLTGRLMAPLQFAAAAGLVALNLLFFIAFALMLGVLTGSRAAVLGIGLGWLFAAGLALDAAPWLSRVLPFGLCDMAGVIAQGAPLASMPAGQLVSSALWSGIFLAVALWRFQRQEL